tara:strand:+ start:1291 stop:1875 length:585 start_codon:yes stop_codon:yes gene_type:complete
MNEVKINKNLKNEVKKIKLLLSKVEEKKLVNYSALVRECIKSIKKRGKIIFFGNGGSASDAQHLATELTVKYKKIRKALPAISLATDTSALTAIGNDFSFDKIFERQIEALGNKNDIAIAISTSGNSNNLIRATRLANKIGMKTFCLVGNNGGKLKKYTRYPIIVPSNEVSHIQAAEIIIGQCLCFEIENYFSK